MKNLENYKTKNTVQREKKIAAWNIESTCQPVRKTCFIYFFHIYVFIGNDMYILKIQKMRTIVSLCLLICTYIPCAKCITKKEVNPSCF